MMPLRGACVPDGKAYPPPGNAPPANENDKAVQKENLSGYKALSAATLHHAPQTVHYSATPQPAIVYDHQSG